MPQSDPQQPDINSKSQRKKDMQALQKLGEALLELSDNQLEKLNLPDFLLTAVQHAKGLSGEARRRQLQYLGKLMREVEIEPIKDAIKEIKRVRLDHAEKFQQTEKWRERLILEGDTALGKFLQQYPEIEAQQLRQLIRKAQHDHKNNKNTGGAKALFIFLREIIKE